jgi:long-chain acyl-CoA synthetase
MKFLRGDDGTDPRTIAGRAIPALLMERAARHPQQVFMRTKHFGVWREQTWADVLDLVRGFAASMAAHGVGAGDRVAMISENIAEAFVAEYATLCRGACFVGIYPDIGIQELLYLLSHSGARLVFAEDQEQVDKVLAIRDQLPALQTVVHIDAR